MEVITMKKDLYSAPEIHAILLHGEKPWTLTLQECIKMVDTECMKIGREQLDEEDNMENEIVTGEKPDTIEATVDDLEAQLEDEPEWEGETDFNAENENELVTGDEADSVETTMDDFEDEITESLQIVRSIKKTISELKTISEQNAYQEFFKSVLAKYGVKSPTQLPPDKRREFFKYVPKEWSKQKKG
jgi:hypothetical protein